MYGQPETDHENPYPHSPIVRSLSLVCPSSPPDRYWDARTGIYSHLPARSPTPPAQYPHLQTKPD